jgi:hypothetical protein
VGRSNSDIMLQECPDPKKPTATTATTDTTDPPTPPTTTAMVLRTLSGQKYASKKKVVHYPYTLGPVDMANSEPWGGQGYFQRVLLFSVLLFSVTTPRCTNNIVPFNVHID